MTNVDAVLQQIRELIAAEPSLADDEDLRSDMLEGQTQLHELASSLVRSADQAQAHADGLSDYLTAIKERRERLTAKVERIRGLIMSLMDAAGQTRLMLPEATLSLGKGRPKAVVTDEMSLPEQFLKITAKPDLAAITAALREGESVPGATLSNSAPTLTIRRG